MKKNIIITIISVLVIVAVCAVSFAAWDVKTANVEFNVFNGASNVVLSVESNALNTTTKLVPKDVNIATSGEAVRVLIGDFKLVLKSDSTKATLEELKEKVVITAGTINITSTVTGFDSAWMKVTILKEDDNGSAMIPGSTKKFIEVTAATELIAGNATTPGTQYHVAIEFADGFANNASSANMANAKAIKTVVNFNCVGRN